MKYELAKELKEAGFIQEGLWGIVYLPEKVSQSKSGVRYCRKGQYKTFPWAKANGFATGGYEAIVLPTLSELIEACDKSDNFLLERLKNKWVALVGSCHKSLEPGNYYMNGKGEGSTPEEAVAMLYLNLHKKNNG